MRRSEHLRHIHRRAVGIGLAVSVGAHAAVLALGPFEVATGTAANEPRTSELANEDQTEFAPVVMEMVTVRVQAPEEVTSAVASTTASESQSSTVAVAEQQATEFATADLRLEAVEQMVPGAQLAAAVIPAGELDLEPVKVHAPAPKRSARASARGARGPRVGDRGRRGPRILIAVGGGGLGSGCTIPRGYFPRTRGIRF